LFRKGQSTCRFLITITRSHVRAKRDQETCYRRAPAIITTAISA